MRSTVDAPAPAPAPVATPVPFTGTWTWDVGNHLVHDRYELVAVAVDGATPAPFVDAVAAAKLLVGQGTKQLPGYGELVPAHAVLRSGTGFVPAVVKLANPRTPKSEAFRLPIDGQIANGSPAPLRGLTFELGTAGAAVAAIVGGTSLLDLREQPAKTTWWRSEGRIGQFGPWKQR